MHCRSNSPLMQKSVRIRTAPLLPLGFAYRITLLRKFKIYTVVTKSIFRRHRWSTSPNPSLVRQGARQFSCVAKMISSHWLRSFDRFIPVTETLIVFWTLPQALPMLCWSGIKHRRKFLSKVPVECDRISWRPNNLFRRAEEHQTSDRTWSDS
jgi:hypothetical protein